MPEWSRRLIKSGAYRRTAFVLALLAYPATSALAQNPPAQTALESRVEELERQNAELRRRLEVIESSRFREEGRVPVPSGVSRTRVAPPTEDASDAAASTLASPVGDVSDEEGGFEGLGLVTNYGKVRASFQLFGDAGAVYANPPEPDTSESTFAIGALDLFATAQVGERFQALSEVVAEGDSSDNEVAFELERLWGSWTLNDALYLKLGREHSPTSHWNRRYHHGKWLWTSATQPFLARFEDDGGPLPVHQVGIEAGGRFDVAAGVLNYVGVISNGRGRDTLEVTNFGDRNDGKAFELGGGFAPQLFPGLTVGADFRADEIPSLGDDPTRARAIRELIETAYVDYDDGALVAIGEVGFVAHKDRTADRTFHHRSVYFQVGYRLGDFTPYTRFDWRDMRRGDPFFIASDLDLDQWDQLFGLRYELTDNAALKLEGGFGRGERRTGAGDTGRRSLSSFAVQLAWGF